eukprot:6156400-Pleurochrysis_carterae.AAC.1
MQAARHSSSSKRPSIIAPEVGPCQVFKAVYSDEGIYGISPATRSDASDRQLCFTWCRLPRMLKTMMYMGLGAML